jgi:hypothetical protein
MSSPDVPVQERPLGELVSQLIRDGSDLVRQEMALGKREIAENLNGFKRQVAAMAVGGVMALLGGMALTAALISLLAQFMPTWIAALIVGALLSAGAGISIARGKAKLEQLELMPEKTERSVRRDIDAIKEAVHDR